MWGSQNKNQRQERMLKGSGHPKVEDRVGRPPKILCRKIRGTKGRRVSRDTWGLPGGKVKGYRAKTVISQEEEGACREGLQTHPL